MKIKYIIWIACTAFATVIYANVSNWLEVVPGAFKATASSSLIEKGKPASFYGPANVIDGKLETAWCSNAHGSTVQGEFIELEIKPTAAQGIHFLPGFGKNQGLYKLNNRIKKARITFVDVSGKIQDEIAEIKRDPLDCTSCYMGDDCSNPQNNEPCALDNYGGGDSISLIFDEYKCIKKVRIEVMDVYKGDKYDDTCIAEIELLTPFGGIVPQDFIEFKKHECEQ